METARKGRRWEGGPVSPDFRADGTAFAATQEDGVFVTTNHGASMNCGKSWHPIDLPCGYDPVLSLVLSPSFGVDGIGFVGTENHGIFTTRDGGITWNGISDIADIGPVNRLAIGPNDADSLVLAALIGTKLYISEDNGYTWRDWLPNKTGSFDLTAFTAKDGFASGSHVCVGSSKGELMSWIV